MSISLTRRQALLAGAAAPIAASIAASTPARAAAPQKGVAIPKFNRVMLGEYEVTTLLAGTRPVPEPHGIFGLNVDDEEFAKVSADAFIPTDVAQFFFTPTLINTGSSLILFDTGLSAEGTVAAVNAAGYEADQIDTVVITHMHGDHIGGLTDDAGHATFANASYLTGRAEFDHWSGADNDGFKAKVAPLAEKFSFLEDGDAPVSGIHAMGAFGHTPGHMGYVVESGGKSLLIGADFANHYIWSVQHPDWEVRFDMDKAAAAKTRRKILDMLAAEKMPFIGYHMPFPGMGYIEAKDSAYRYVPASYQLVL